MTASSILSYTQDMMMVVIEQRWDVLLDMQLKQDEMLRALFAGKGDDFSVVEKAGLVEVQRLNQEILSSAEAHKSELASKLHDIRQGKSQIDAYHAL